MFRTFAKPESASGLVCPSFFYCSRQPHTFIRPNATPTARMTVSRWVTLVYSLLVGTCPSLVYAPLPLCCLSCQWSDLAPGGERVCFPFPVMKQSSGAESFPHSNTGRLCFMWQIVSNQPRHTHPLSRRRQWHLSSRCPPPTSKIAGRFSQLVTWARRQGSLAW